MAAGKTGRIKRIWLWLLCHILKDHTWTCAAEEGISPTPKQLEGGIRGFNDYATRYCKHCGYVYVPEGRSL